jgi:hypothetical protein
MADSAVAITPGSGASIDAYAVSGGDLQQIIRKAKATAEADDFWTISTTAATSRIAADASRLGVHMVNMGSGRVYLRHDSTAPTATVCHFYLEAGERWEMPDYAVTLAISVLGQFAGGTLNTTLFTAA